MFLQRLLTDFAIHHPRKVMAISAFLTLFFLAAFPSLTTDTDPVHMLPADNEAVVRYEQLKQEFALADMVGVGIESKDGSSLFTVDGLQKIHAITEEILQIEDAAPSDSAFMDFFRTLQFLRPAYDASSENRDLIIKSDLVSVSTVDDIVLNESGELLVVPLMDTPPTTQAEADKVFATLDSNALYSGKLVSRDGSLVSIFIPIVEGKKDRSYYLGEQIKQIVDKHLGDNEIFYFAGLPIAESTFGMEMFIQMGVFAPMAGLVIFVLMLYFFHSAKVVAAPMMLAMMAVIWAMGGLIYSGNVIHIMSSMIPIFLMPIAVLNSIHILSKLSEHINHHEHKEEAIRHVMQELFFPMLYTSLTTIVGFTSLATTGIPPVMVFGVTVGVGVFLSWLLSMVFIPAYTMLLSESALVSFAKRGKAKSPIVEVVQGFRLTSLKFPGTLMMVSAVLVVVSYIGLTKIIINDNPVRWFKQDHFIRIADESMNEKLAGTYVANLRLSIPEEVRVQADAGGEEVDEFAAFEEASSQAMASVRDPQVIHYMAQLDEYFKGVNNADGTPLVGGVSSVLDALKKVGSVTFGTDELPQTREEISQYIFLFESGDTKGGKDLWQLIHRDSDSQATQMQLYFKSGDNMKMDAAMAALEEFMVNNPAPTFTAEDGQVYSLQLEWSGLMHINNVWQAEMVTGMQDALISSFVIVFIMMVVLFRSVLWGILAMLPLSITILFIYGIIGFSGKFYDMPIAVLSSLTLGLSIDFAIHFIEHIRLYNRRSKNFMKSFDEMFQGTAQAIWRNVLVIAIGFSPLFFAGLVPYLTVGSFFFLIMIVSGITTLLLMPAIVVKFHHYLPGFREFEMNNVGGSKWKN